MNFLKQIEFKIKDGLYRRLYMMQFRKDADGQTEQKMNHQLNK